MQNTHAPPAEMQNENSNWFFPRQFVARADNLLINLTCPNEGNILAHCATNKVCQSVTSAENNCVIPLDSIECLLPSLCRWAPELHLIIMHVYFYVCFVHNVARSSRWILSLVWCERAVHLWMYIGGPVSILREWIHHVIERVLSRAAMALEWA